MSERSPFCDSMSGDLSLLCHELWGMSMAMGVYFRESRRRLPCVSRVHASARFRVWRGTSWRPLLYHGRAARRGR